MGIAERLALAASALVSLGLPLRTSGAQAPTASERLSAVCEAVGCDAAALRASRISAEVRLRHVQEVLDRGRPAVYLALDAPAVPDLANALTEAESMEAVRKILQDAPPLVPEAGTGISTLGIPQAHVRHPHPYLLERSQLYPFQHGLVLEALVAPHLYVLDTLTHESVRLHGGNAFAALVTPMFKVRIRHEQSAPVQTLSFMPKLTLQYFRLPTKADTSPWPSAFWMKGISFAWGHHSNGQTECIFTAGVPDNPDVCIAPAQPRDVRVNYPNGSFSTNYLKLSVFGTRQRLGKLQPVPGSDRAFQQVAHSKTTVSATLEINPSGLPPGGALPEPARSLYGPTRMGLGVEHESRIGCRGFWTGSYRLTRSAEFIDKTTEAGSSRFRFTAESAWEPDWFRSGGFIIRYVHGQDYYNLQFDRDIHWLQVGIVFSASEFEPFLSALPGKSNSPVTP
jgi:hypothetical protein